jgi:hypothetical protein
MVVVLLVFGGCGGTEELEGDVGDDTAESLSAIAATIGGQARVTASSLNLRSGPGTTHRVLTTMPQGSLVTVVARSGAWLSVQYQGTTGWAFEDYLEGVVPDTGGGGTDSPSVAAAIERAESGLGFSYHWGGGCWNPGSSAHGACYGSCPNCSHSGTWGADCSGYVSKVWQVPGPEALTHCSHPYNTTSFYTTHPHWRDVSRSSAKRGDAFVRRGHIFIYDRGDAWGTMRAYEARGCSYGIVHSSRSADSSYKVIRRNGF